MAAPARAATTVAVLASAFLLSIVRPMLAEENAMAQIPDAGRATRSLDGSWTGVLDLGSAKLHLDFEISTTAGITTGALISPDQSGARIPISEVDDQGGQVVFAVPAIGAQFSGKIDDPTKPQTLNGAWSQSGRTWPLFLQRRQQSDLGPGDHGDALARLPPHVSEMDVRIDVPGGALQGTLAYRGDGPHAPAALLLPGSGPTDRNGNVPVGPKPNTMQLLAYGLAERGITTLRVDKRGIGGSMAGLVDESSLRVEDFVADACNWTRKLREIAGAAPVWIIGHSEGGLIAELAAIRNRDVRGIVLLAAPGRKLGDVLIAQLRAANQPKAVLAREIDAVRELEAGRTFDAPPSDSLFRPSAQAYLSSEFRLDPAQLLAETKVPVLILQGDADRKVTIEDAERLEAARPDAELAIVPGATHVLRSQNAGSEVSAATPLLPQYASTIADFIDRHSGNPMPSESN